MHKLQWYVSLSLTVTGTALIAVFGLLSLNAYYLHDSEKKIKILCDEKNDNWEALTILTLPASMIFGAVYCYAAWMVIVTNKKRHFLALLIANGVCIGLGAYLSLAFYIEMDQPLIDGDGLFNRTKALIAEKMVKLNKTWLPLWLDTVQKDSTSCCGIRSFRDWEFLWPALETDVPQTCCKEKETCLTDMSMIPYPETASKYVKTDEGCLEDLKKTCLRNVHHSCVYTLVVTILMAFCEAVFGMQFFIQYVKHKREATLILPQGANAASTEGMNGSSATIQVDVIPQRTESSGWFSRWCKKFKKNKEAPAAPADQQENLPPTSPPADYPPADHNLVPKYYEADLYHSPRGASGSSMNNSASPSSFQSQGTLPSSVNHPYNAYPQQQPYQQRSPGHNTPQHQQALSTMNPPQTHPQPLPSSYHQQPYQQQHPPQRSSIPTPSASADDHDHDGRKNHHKNFNKQDDQTGNSGSADHVRAQQVYMVPDTSNDGSELRGASPSPSTDDVGDKLAPGMRPSRRKSPGNRRR